ncbi:MAG: nucleotidyl transferase AbiEii/AbiGii toxin family protein [Clostridiaceae bacterium]|jgi:hypothetical protein|nr:nucleotidyl transferase AbiEii/AbiGii toxin family protein [Clostridiaceae bacterium]
MIDPESRSREWIESLRTKYPEIKDPALFEKTIRAFSLLESLVLSGCPFIFKGGTALMLHFDTPKRLSIDVDIICKPGTNILRYLGKFGDKYGFTEVKEIERTARNHVPKTHAEYKYEVSYPSGHPSDKILLDVLYENLQYEHIIPLQIRSPFLKIIGEPAIVKCPSLSDMLGDKLTAFAPHTTGIPFFKGDKPFSMEIMKQLFDISSIFDRISDITSAVKTFHKTVPIELSYKGLDSLSAEDVLNDAYATALNICLRGAISKPEYEYLVNGARRVNGFIITENYSMERAILDASKVAYLTCLIKNDKKQISHYEPNMNEILINDTIKSPELNKMNHLKKLSLEAFYYWKQVEIISAKE